MGGETSLGTDRSLLVLRVRRPGSGAPETALEVEALLDYETIFPAALTQLDTRALEHLALAPDNAYGRAIGEALCAASSVELAVAAIGRRERVRIQLMIEGAGSHCTVRWERAQLPCWPDRPIALRTETPFSRFAAVNAAQQDPPEDQMFRLLFAVAAPTAGGLAPIDAAAECRLIVEACEELLADSRMALTLLAGARPLPDDARKALERPRVEIVDGATTAERLGELVQRVHACHIVAHGTFADPDFYLLLEDEQGNLAARRATELIRSWNLRSLQLVLLQSCQSAASAGVGDPRPGVGGFMQQLLEAGVPAVVAMQDTVRMDDAQKFSRAFYGSLLSTGLIDEAANHGRSALENTPDYAWSIPAAATRLKQAAIWRESPLRAAARTLVERQEELARNKYPAFPIEVGLARAGERTDPDGGQDDLETVLTGNEPRLEAEEALRNAAGGDRSPAVTCLIAARGRAKTTLLEKLYVRETKRHWDEIQPRVPVLLSLGDLARSELDADGAMSAAVAAWFKSRVDVEIAPSYVRGCFRKQPFLFLIRGDDDQSETLMQAGLAVLAEFRKQRTDESERHRYVLTLDQNALKVSDVPADSDWLFVLPMAAECVRRYLRSLPEDAGDFAKILLNTLEDNGLFDLAEVPWLLSEMLDQARRGVLDHTRAQILKRIVDGRIARFPGSAGMRFLAEEVVSRLGWELMNGRARTMPAPELFSLLAEVRGNRDYSLASFRAGLIDACSLLAPSGEDGVRFAYPGFRTYCCAEYLRRQTPERRTALLTDITASLGRRSRLDWWGEALFVLAGRWDQTEELLRLILSGAPLQEGDQLYIAARCLQEARQSFGDRGSDDPLIRSIVSGLIYRSHPLSSRSVASRKEALGYLGPLKELCALPHLVSLVLEPVRPDAQGRPAYDYSGVRLAALKALLYMPELAMAYIRSDPAWASRTCLHDTVDAWIRFDIERLKAALETSTDDAVTAVAAFAVGLARLEGGFASLRRRFLASGSGDVLWALADSMVESRDPGLDGFLQSQLGNADREAYIAYLIGKTGTAAAGSEERKFLFARLDAKDELLRGRCLRSLAELHDCAALEPAHAWLNSPSQVLCYYALQALRLIGNKDSLGLIEKSFWTAYDTRGGAAPSLLLEQLRLEAYDEIYWRLAGGLSREVMAPIRQKRS
jgi:hypothetical protein